MSDTDTTDFSLDTPDTSGPPGGGVNASASVEAQPDLRDVYESVGDAEPDHAAKVLHLSRATGQPPEFVNESVPDFERATATPTREQFKEIQKQHPVVGKFLSNPLNMAIAYDDTKNLVAHSHANKEVERALGLADAISVGLQNSILGMTLRNKLPSKSLPEDASFTDKFAASAAQFAADFPYFAAGGAAGGIIGSFGGPTGAVAGAAAGGFALPDAYRTALKQHMESGDEASAVDFAKQFFTLNTLKSGLKGSAIGLLTAGAGAAAKPLGALASMGAEAATMTTAGAAMEGRKPTLDDAASNVLLMGMMHGAGVLGGAALDRAFPQRVADTIRVETTRDAAELLDKSSKSSKLRARDPQGFEKLLNVGKPIMVPVEKFESYFQSKGMEPGQVSNDLGASESYEYARQHGEGASVIIPQGKWLGEGMDTHRSALADDIKFSQDHLTANEYKIVTEQEKEFSKQRDEFIKKNGDDAAAITAASEPAKAAHADITFDVRQRLEATKQFPQGLATPDARDSWLNENAKRVADYFISESSRRKVDPLALYAAEGPRITGGGASAVAGAQQQEPGTASGGTPSGEPQTSPETQAESPSGEPQPSRREPSTPYYTRPELQTRSSTWSITDNPDLVKASREERFNALLADEAKAYDADPGSSDFHKWIVDRARNNIQRGYKALTQMRDLPEKTRDALLHSMQRDQERLDLMSGIHPNAHVDFMGRPMIESLHQDSPLAIYKPELADASYSKLIQTFDQKIQGKTATAEQVKAIASNFKEDERKWTGFDKFMEGKSGKIDKKELLDFLNANRLQIEDRVLGEPANSETPAGKELAAESLPESGMAAFARWAAGRGENESTLGRMWRESTNAAMAPLVRMFADEHPALLAGEPTEADFRTWAASNGWAEDQIQNALRRHEAGQDGQIYTDFMEARRIEAGGLPSIDDLSDDELAEKVKEQYEDSINERASEIESDNIDNNFNDWGVTAAEKETDWGDVEIDDVEEGDDGKWIVHLSGANSLDIEAADEGEARSKAEKMINDGSDEIELNKYWTLEQGGSDYRGTRYDSRTQRRVPMETWFESENEAQNAADEANDRERENMWGNSDGSEYQEALDEFVEEVRSGTLSLDDYENGSGSSKKKTDEKKAFKWDKARYESSYVLPGAEPGSVREIVFHAPQLEAYNATDKTHFGDISEGKEIGWTRTGLHKDDKGTLVRLANEFQNNRTQKGAATGYAGENQEQHTAWNAENKKLTEATSAARVKAGEVKEKLEEKYLNESGRFDLLTELPDTHKIIENPSVHKFATKEEASALTRRYMASQDVMRNAHRTSPEYKAAQDENSAVYKLLPDAVPGWGKGEQAGAKYWAVNRGDETYAIRWGDTPEEATQKALERLNENRQESRNDLPHAERIEMMNWVEKQPEYIAAREAQEAAAAAEAANDAIEPKVGNVPDTPFKNNSYEFQFKRLLRWHIEQDYKAWQASGSAEPFVDWWKKSGIKQLAWTTGMQQAERNNRVDDVDKLVYDPVKQELSAFKNGHNKINGAKMAPDEIAAKLGGGPQVEQIVKRLLATEPIKESEEATFSPENVKVHVREDDYLVTSKDGKSVNIGKGTVGSEQAAREYAVKYFIGKYGGEEAGAHAGSHVIHDEGGIKVAANAKFYQDLYDMKIPSFVKKFAKQWGGTVGEAMIKTGEQKGALRYEGGEPGLIKLEKIGREVAASGDAHKAAALRNILEDMKGGKSFSDSFAQRAEESPTAYGRLAEEFGGKLITETSVRHERVHALNITPEIAQAAITQGFPLFQGEGSNPQGEYVPSRNEIRLGKNSDETTFMHEFAHGALEHMFKFVKAGQADEAYLEHFGAMKDFLGIKDDQESLTREQHEKFARGWERYLRGEQDEKTKAPTRELQGAYDLFRKWFTKVYKQISGSPISGNLTPEARGFFDRMVASEEQIAQAAQESGYKGAEIASIEGLDPATQLKHRTLQERARDKAENAMLKDNMVDLQAERKVSMDAERERQTKRIEPEVADHPLYRASQDVEENRPGAHRSAASLSDDFLSGKLSAQEQGAFESAAEVHGFSDGRDLAESIKADAEKGGQAGTLKRRVDEAMTPFDQNSDALREAALKSIHEHQMTELLALEQEILSDMQHDQEVRTEVAKRRRVSASMAAADAKQKAKDFLATRPLNDAASFRAYITAERKAAVKVSQALADGNFEEAAKAKGQQMLNHALAAEAMKNKAEINRKGKYLDKFIKRGQDMLNMPYGFVTKIDDMLVKHGLMEPRDPALQATLQKNAESMAQNGDSAADIANATGLVQDASGKWSRETLAGFVQRVNDDYYPISLPDSVMQSESLHQRQPNMTMAELRDLHEAIKIVNAVGTGFERYLSDFVKGDIKVAASQFKKQVEANIGTPYGNVPALGDLDMNKLEKAVAAIKAQPDGMIASKVNLLTLSEYLDRLDPDGEAKKNLYRPLRGAENKERAMKVEYTERLEAIREKHYTKDEISKMSDESFAKWQIQTPDGMKNVRLTKENALVLLLNRGSESNLDRLVRGFGVDAEKIKEITDGLSKRDHDFAQDIWHYVDTLWPEASALEMKVNGMEPKKVHAIPVESVHGTYAGGYYPLSYDFTKSADAYKNAEQRNALYKQYSTAAAHTEQGALKERVKSLDRPVRLTFDGLFNHLEDVIHDISYRPSVIDVSRFLNQPDAKNAIVNAIGLDGYKKIMDDLKSAASAQTDFMTPTDRRMRWFRFASSFATLGYRIAIFPRRLTEDVVNTMREVGFKNAVGATADYIMNPTTTREFVLQNVPVMRERGITRERDLMAMSSQWKGRDSKLKAFAFLQDTIADQAMSYPVAAAVYKQNLAKHGPELAGQLAGEAIIKTFGSGSQIDRVGAQRGGELNQLVSMYYSWHSMMFNRAWLQGKIAGLEYNEGNFGKALAIIAATTATTWVIPAATDIFWHEVLHNAPQGQESDEEKHKRRLAKFLEAPFAYFPLARNVAAFAIPKLLGEHGRAYKMSPAEDAIENLATTAAEGTHTMFDPNKEFDQKQAEQAARSASILLGTPNQLNTMVFNFKDYLDGEGELTWRDAISRRTKK